ncbi:Uncharacterised protein [Mycobacterium tuberculosis]|nr:Uncharacterised protein [Mycobacterium tuberculosis]
MTIMLDMTIALMIIAHTNMLQPNSQRKQTLLLLLLKQQKLPR